MNMGLLTLVIFLTRDTFICIKKAVPFLSLIEKLSKNNFSMVYYLSQLTIGKVCFTYNIKFIIFTQTNKPR